MKINKWLLSHLQPYKWRFLFILLGSIYIMFIEIMYPWTAQYLIDWIIPSQNYNTFFRLVTLLLIVTLIMVVIKSKISQYQLLISENVIKALQETLIKHLFERGITFSSKIQAGETNLLLFNDCLAVQKFYNQYLPTFIQSMLVSSTVLVILLSLNPVLALLSVLPMLTFYLFSSVLAKKTKIFNLSALERKSVYVNTVYDTFSGIKEIKNFAAGKWRLNEIKRQQDNFDFAQLKSGILQSVRSNSRHLTNNLGMVVLFVYGGHLIHKNQITIGSLVSFIFYYSMLINYLGTLINQTIEFQAIKLQIERVYNFIRYKESVQVEEHNKMEDFEELRFDHVCFHYTLDKTILREVSFDLKAGEKMAIIGKSGIGKSTLLYLIAGIYRPDKGRILWNGLPLEQYSNQQIYRKIGFLFQDTYIFTLSIKENIAMGKENASDKEVIEAAKKAYIHEYICSLPDGYETVLQKNGSNLSGGQMQRIALARVILKRPQLIILDEATNAMDTILENKVKKALNELGVSIISITHQTHNLHYFDRVLELDESRNTPDMEKVMV